MPRVFTGVSADSRSSISFAALLVNVTARIDSGPACPVASSHAMRVVSTRVLPRRAPARISADACGSVTAASCSGFKFSRSGEAMRRMIADSPQQSTVFDAALSSRAPSTSLFPPAALSSTPMPRAPDVTPPVNSATMRAFVHWIRAAAPYVHAFRGKTFVIAFGGEVVADEEFLGVVHDLNLLHSLGIRLVVAHGCRPQVEAILEQQDIESRYANGVRVTDPESMDCVLEAAGQARARIEALLSLGLANSPMAGARNRVSSGNYLTAKPMGVVNGVDMQLTGEVRRIDTEAIQQRLDDGDLVLISPIGYSPTGEIFNLTVEEVATQVPRRLRAPHLLFPL